MNTISKTLLSAGVLGAAALFALPTQTVAFTTIGGSLSISGSNYQRDVRIFPNSNDVAADNNTLADPDYPGALGSLQAIWKGARAWNSDVGLTNRNFDFEFQGEATSNGGNNGNTVSWQTGSPCGGGVLAFMQGPISDGWTIRFCDQFNWADGPGSPAGGQVDIQGIASHELGHALGLGHTGVGCGGSCGNDATMCAFACGNGTNARDTEPDDIAGVQFIYGAFPANKPIITSLSGSSSVGGTLTINGSGFPNTVNVKFTAGTTQNSGTIPGVVYNVNSVSSNQINVTIPNNAQDGNVAVWAPSISRLSNPFPFDLDSAPPPPPSITLINPGTVEALGGTQVTIIGNNFNGATQVNVGTNVLTPPLDLTVVDNNTITFSAPQATSLGGTSVTVTTPNGTSNPGNLNYIATDPLTLLAPAFMINGTQAPFTWAGQPNQISFMSISGTNTTGVAFGETLLLPLVLLQLQNTNAAGVATISPTVSGAPAGTTLFFQIWTIAPPGNDGSTLEASNIESSNVII